jgi:hypothetical protein
LQTAEKGDNFLEQLEKNPIERKKWLLPLSNKLQFYHLRIVEHYFCGRATEFSSLRNSTGVLLAKALRKASLMLALPQSSHFFVSLRPLSWPSDAYPGLPVYFMGKANVEKHDAMKNGTHGQNMCLAENGWKKKESR